MGRRASVRAATAARHAIFACTLLNLSSQVIDEKLSGDFAFVCAVVALDGLSRWFQASYARPTERFSAKLWCVFSYFFVSIS